MVELADSLDSGSSVHYGRAGSSPASRTKKGHPKGCLLFCQSSVAKTEKTGLFMLFPPEMTVLSVLLFIVAYLSELLSVWSAGGQRKTAATPASRISLLYPDGT